MEKRLRRLHVVSRAGGGESRSSVLAEHSTSTPAATPSGEEETCLLHYTHETQSSAVQAAQAVASLLHVSVTAQVSVGDLARFQHKIGPPSNSCRYGEAKFDKRKTTYLAKDLHQRLGSLWNMKLHSQAADPNVLVWSSADCRLHLGYAVAHAGRRTTDEN